LVMGRNTTKDCVSRVIMMEWVYSTMMYCKNFCKHYSTPLFNDNMVIKKSDYESYPPSEHIGEAIRDPLTIWIWMHHTLLML
jgi:hypothetical protein